MNESTMWKNWREYFSVSREGYLKVKEIYQGSLKRGTYLLPQLKKGRKPCYRLRLKGVFEEIRLQDLVKEVWNKDKVFSIEEAKEMRANIELWNSLKAKQVAQKKEAEEKPFEMPKKIDHEFLDPDHPQFDPFSNWR